MTAASLAAPGQQTVDRLAWLLTLGQRDLARVFAGGTRVGMDQLAQTKRVRGISLGLPPAMERMTWKLFAKEFGSGQTYRQGCNVRVAQPAAWDARGLLTAPLVAHKTFLPFVLRGHPRHGAIIDYGAAYDPLRDVGDGLMLGVTLLSLPSAMSLPTPTWFVIRHEA